MFNFSKMFGSNMFGKIGAGMCRVGMNGELAIKTSSGYKTYDVKTGRLVNCDSFAFDIGEELFFLIPTNKPAVGDIILINGRPHAVRKFSDNDIEAFCYEDSTIVHAVPEHHIFMGNTFFYGKIVSLMGNLMNKENGMQNLMQMAMLSEMFGNKGVSTTSDMGSMFMMMSMLNGNNAFTNMFDGLFTTPTEVKED